MIAVPPAARHHISRLVAQRINQRGEYCTLALLRKLLNEHRHVQFFAIKQLSDGDQPAVYPLDVEEADFPPTIFSSAHRRWHSDTGSFPARAAPTLLNRRPSEQLSEAACE